MSRPLPIRDDRRTSRYWDEPARNTPSLGCSICLDRKRCGGLHVASGAFDCLTYCCGRPANCDNVCPKNQSFVDRVREVGGFDLSSVGGAPKRDLPALPDCIPLLFSRVTRARRFAPTAVSIQFHQLFHRRTGVPKFASREQICSAFGVADSVQLVLSATAEDTPLERWWSLGSKRRGVLAWLSELGLAAATSPNFSVFADVPRWDNFHAAKRIGVCWQEMAAANIPTALHLNARMANDWRQWTEFVKHRPEITAISYEFATGAGMPGRFAFHVEELKHLADRVSRPLRLIVRGGLSALADLRRSFERVSMIDTTTYMRTVYRQIGIVSPRGGIVWKAAPGRPDVDMDALLEQNYLAMSAVVSDGGKR